MDNQKTDLDRNLLIARRHWDVPVRVPLRPYLQFSRCIDGQLCELIARWTHVAPPGAAKYRGTAR